MGRGKNKKSQITIFVIIGLIIVVSIALIFAFSSRSGGTVSAAADPQAYMDGCIKNSLTKAEATLITNNGYANISDNFMLYRGEKVPYLCAVSQFYFPCVNQEPMLFEHYKKEIGALIKNDAEKCFAGVIDSSRAAGYEVTAGEMIFEIDLMEKSIVAKFEKSIKLVKGDETRIYQKFSSEIPSPLYNIAKTEKEIINWESMLCEFDQSTWMFGHLDILIKKFTASDGSRVYTVTDKATDEEMSFAVRSCLLPLGI